MIKIRVKCATCISALVKDEKGNLTDEVNERLTFMLLDAKDRPVVPQVLLPFSVSEQGEMDQYKVGGNYTLSIVD